MNTNYVRLILVEIKCFVHIAQKVSRCHQVVFKNDDSAVSLTHFGDTDDNRICQAVVNVLLADINGFEANNGAYFSANLLDPIGIRQGFGTI